MVTKNSKNLAADSHPSINNPNDERVDRLERLVESLLTDKISRGRDSFVIRSDCITLFAPGESATMTSDKLTAGMNKQRFITCKLDCQVWQKLGTTI